jgi:hypothetical protein
MLAKHSLILVLVRPGHGVGDEAASNVDGSVVYDGHAMRVSLKQRDRNRPARHQFEATEFEGNAPDRARQDGPIQTVS